MSRVPAARSVVLLAALALGACAAGPDYRTPSSPLGAQYNAGPLVAARDVASPAPALDRWWAGFGDPLLDSLVDEALSQNLDIVQAAARVDQARAAAHAAGAQLLPVGQAGASAARQRQSLESPTGQLFRHFPGYQRTGDLYDLNAGASWEIDLFGQLRRNAEAARADAAVAEAGRAGARLTVAAETADAYLQIRGLQQRIAAIGELTKAQDAIAALVAERADAGAASDLERQQAKAQAATVRANLPLLEAGLEAQYNRLDVLLAKAPGATRARMAAPGALPAPPAISPGDGPAKLLRRRPDVIAAERHLAAENARIGVAMADYWPKVTIAGLLGFEATQTGRLVTGAGQTAQGALTGDWRLFDFGRVDAEVKAARGRRAEALAAWKEAALRANEEVEDALTSLVKREAQARHLDEALAANVTAERQAEDARRAGVLSRIESLQTRSARLQAQDNALEARTEAARAAVASFRALGGGWSAH